MTGSKVRVYVEQLKTLNSVFPWEYRVTKVVNTMSPHVGEVLHANHVADLIDALGYHVEITLPRKGQDK